MYFSFIIPLEIQSERRPGFSPTYTLKGLGIDKLYEKKYLIQEFKKIKEDHDIIQDDNSENYYARNHETEMGAFVESLYQNQTFLLINAFPGKKKYI